MYSNECTQGYFANKCTQVYLMYGYNNYTICIIMSVLMYLVQTSVLRYIWYKCTQIYLV